MTEIEISAERAIERLEFIRDYELQPVDKLGKAAIKLAIDCMKKQANGVMALPCKFGDPFYMIVLDCYRCEHFYEAKYIEEDSYCEIETDFNCKRHVIVEGKMSWSFWAMVLDGRAGQYYLTREEAETALAIKKEG